MSTISEIAKRANVSRGTVDRVIHNRGRVSKENAEKVKKVLKELNYKPNIFARGLSLSKEYRFGVLIPDTSNDVGYWRLPAKGIQKAQDELLRYNVKVEYFNYDNSTEISFKKACDSVLQKRTELDGLLIAPVLSKSIEGFISDLPPSLPYVFIDANIPNTKSISYIGSNSYKSGLTAGRLMKTLIKNTTTPCHVGIIQESPENFHINRRIEGFKDFMSTESPSNIMVYDADRRKDTKIIRKVTCQILEESPEIRGIFIPSCCCNEVAACIKEVNPENKIYVIGYDLTNENIELVTQGYIDFLLSQRPEIQGYQGIYTLYQYTVLGERVEKEYILPFDIFVKENLHFQ